jgi:hypothetical protein
MMRLRLKSGSMMMMMTRMTTTRMKHKAELHPHYRKRMQRAQTGRHGAQTERLRAQTERHGAHR